MDLGHGMARVGGKAGPSAGRREKDCAGQKLKGVNFGEGQDGEKSERAPQEVGGFRGLKPFFAGQFVECGSFERENASDGPGGKMSDSLQTGGGGGLGVRGHAGDGRRNIDGLPR